MTACTNNGGKARRVVTAALVGVLSVGAVPAIALATGTGDVSLQSVQPAHVLVEADDGFGNDVEIVEGKAVKLEAGTDQYLRPTKIADSLDSSLDIDDYDITYLASDGVTPLRLMSGETINDTNAATYFLDQWDGTRTQAGKSYWVQIKKGAEDILKVQFTYVAPTYAGVYAYDTDLDDTTFTYDGDQQSIHFADEDGVTLSPSKVRYLNADSSVAAENGNTPVNAGTYTAELTFTNAQKVNVTVTIDPFALDTAGVFAQDTTVPTDVDTRDELLDTLDITGFTGTPKHAHFKVTKVESPNGGSTLGGGSGKYTVTIEGSDAEVKAGNITGAATISYYVLDDDLQPASVVYGTNPIPAGGLHVSLPDGESFDDAKVKVVSGDDEYDGKALELSYVDKKTGAKVDAGALSKPGVYTVHYRVVPFQNSLDKWIGQSGSFTLIVDGQKIEANAGLTYSFDGKVVADNGTGASLVPGVTTQYTGSDLMERIGIEVKDEDGKVYAEGTDYTVTIKKGSKTVDSIVDVDTYTITVNPVTFDADRNSTPADWVLTVVVTPMRIDEAVVNGSLEANKKVYVAWTGEEISPTFTFYSDGKAVDVPADAYEVTYDLYKVDASGSFVPPAKKTDVAVKDEGGYRATIEAAKGVKNYEFAFSPTVGVSYYYITTDFLVTKKGVFLDVPAGEWYSQAVYDAAKLGYMNGDGGGYTFSPMRELTRAEAACVLFNMAGGDTMYSNETIPGYNTEGEVYETGFSDVEGNEFFAKAVAWCEATGIINGYADGTFGVSRKVTNEEFACMLANLAKAKGEDVSVEDADAVLAGYPDAGLVSDWAKEAVAWAVQEGVMGNGPTLSPAGSILRMRAATMVVNYQPEGVFDSVFEFESQEQGE